MPGLNTAAYTVEGADLAAILSASPILELRPAAPPPALLEVPRTIYSAMADKLVALGGPAYQHVADRLRMIPYTHPCPDYLDWNERYIADHLEYANNLRRFASFINSAFGWSMSAEGASFWIEVDDHLCGHPTGPLPTTDAPLPTHQWELREMDRFRKGTYLKLPWAGELTVIPRHYAHISTVDPTAVSFTPDDVKGAADRQVRMKPGRYLAKFYPDMDPDDVRKYAAMLDAAFTQLHFATTPDEIEEVYANGPHSCMSYSASHFSSKCHPARIYGAGDLAVAYTKRGDGKVSGRCLVWPDRKQRGRIYGDVDKMEMLLRAAGYDDYEHDLEGARLLKIEDSGGYVMPYIDNSNSWGFHPDGKHLQIGGAYDATNTCGLSNEGTWCPFYEEYVDVPEEDFVYIYDVDESWSPRAAENHAFYCYHTGRTYSNDHGSHEVIVPSRYGISGRTTETWSTDAVEDNAWLCDATEEYLSDDIASVEVEGVGYVDPKWAEENCTACHVSGDLYPTDQLVEDKDGNLVHPDNLEDDAAAAA